ILFLVSQKHSLLWFKELKTKVPKRMKKHTDQTRLPYNYKLIFRTTLKVVGIIKTMLLLNKI
ncbi:MAG: hypothetical protein IJT13_00370, partial [Bacteroidaceae bacterium]|nr:hypothetical protein [Bacteroidaceae bacterium]